MTAYRELKKVKEDCKKKLMMWVRTITLSFKVKNLDFLPFMELMVLHDDEDDAWLWVQDGHGQ